MRTVTGQWSRGVMVLAIGSVLLFTGCAETMMGGDKEMMKEKGMMKEGGMMKKEGGMMKEEGMMKKDGGMMKEEKPTMEKK